MVSLAVGFLLFGLLQGVDAAFGAAVQRQRLDRLLIDPRFGEPLLPRTYAERIERVPGVTNLVWTQFLLGFYREPANGLLVITTEPTRFFSVRSEYQTPPETLQALARTRTGLIVLESLATRMGWKVGDKVTLQTQVPQRDGSTHWTFDVVGFLTNPANPGQIGFALGNYEYLEEARANGRGTVGRFVVRIDDPGRSVEVSRAIDLLFQSSPAPTRTMTENEIAQAQLASVGDVRLMSRAIIAAVFFAIAFLTGNTILQSVRERTSELGTLKALGYADSTVLLLVMSEALVLCLCAAVVGLGASVVGFPIVSQALPAVSAWVGTARMSLSVIVFGFVFATSLALLSAAIPAWRTTRLKVVDAWPSDDRPFMRSIAQIVSVTALGLSSLPRRFGTSMVVVVGVATVVAVFTAVLSMASGFEKTMANTGSPGRAIILGGSSNTESGSSSRARMYSPSRTRPAVARSPRKHLLSCLWRTSAPDSMPSPRCAGLGRKHSSCGLRSGSWRAGLSRQACAKRSSDAPRASSSADSRSAPAFLSRRGLADRRCLHERRRFA